MSIQSTATTAYIIMQSHKNKKRADNNNYVSGGVE